MKTFRITKIKNAIEPLFGIVFNRIRSRVWQEYYGVWREDDGPLYTIYYYEDFGDTNAMVFDGFINLSTNKIVVNDNTTSKYFEFQPKEFSSTREIINVVIECLSVVMKNRYRAIMRESKINSILL